MKCWERAGNKKPGRIPVLCACVLKRRCALAVKTLNCTLRGFLLKPETKEMCNLNLVFG